MGFQFKKHYTKEEAKSLLPKVQVWLDQLALLREQLVRCEEPLARLSDDGYDLGGERVHRMVRTLVNIKGALGEFHSREIQIKDLDRGLIDFPAFIGGKEVFLCWEKGELDIEYWHDLDTGFSGREKI
ncbi:MAG: hypothetical protein ACI8QF_001654 [Limisphaerales bacterium]|jgi:hypothetical protein